VIGLFDVLLNLAKIYRARKTICTAIRQNPPDLLILIDYSGFNLRLVKMAKQAGLKVLYYISPQLWASRTRRVNVIRKYVDRVAVIFPFEVDFYKKLHVPATFVGHPLVTTVHPSMPHTQAIEHFGLKPDYKTIGIFPGSRKGEIKRLLPVMLKAAELAANRFPHSQFILPLASSLAAADLQPYLQKSRLNIQLITEQNYDAINICDAIIAKSGTTTLEIALLSVPLVIVYKIWPPYFPIKSIIKIPYIGLCNIVAGKEIAKELLQQQASPYNISQEIVRILTEPSYRNQMLTELGKVKSKLVTAETTDIAELVINML
ncbi:MAG: lipid-A-disaccharide synthase, partial [Gammaproteobacteria bacterium]|nr:lipid-A-disaccharide synthase [Gammaproteobacteria bacterium]